MSSLHFAIVVGSQRAVSRSRKVAEFVRGAIRANSEQNEVVIVDLGREPLPLWDEEFSAKHERWAGWSRTSQILAGADAVVIVTPEWGGMVTPATKNLFLLCRNGELRHKPGLAVAVSASFGGAYPIAELRMTTGKNTQFCYIPDHVIVRRAESVLNGEQPESKEDADLRDRIRHAVRVLAEYAKALRGVRSSGIDSAKYPFGM
jgi:NAD(P)H-dependent FMN reductase